jgi:hypothetical protein
MELRWGNNSLCKIEILRHIFGKGSLWRAKQQVCLSSFPRQWQGECGNAKISHF